MSDNLFHKLNQQRIPDEAREVLIRTGDVEIANDRIRIGSFWFPYDIFHVMEIFNVLEGRSADLENEEAQLRRERIQFALDFFMASFRRFVDELKQLRDGPERDNYARLLSELIEDVRKLFS